MKLVRDLPEIFEQFGEQKKESFLEVKKYKEKGKPVIGAYCSYFPRELAMAVGAIPVGLCSSSNDTVAIAEQTLPANICPLIKSSYGFAVSDKCPFFYFSDIVVGETTCDGKKKMYELLSDQKRLYFYQVGQGADRDYVRPLIKSEVKYLIKELKKRFDIDLSDESIREASALVNAERESILSLMAVQKSNPPVAWGGEIFKALEKHRVLPDIRDRIMANEKTREELLAGKSPVPKNARRILITGCPMSGVYSKIVDTIESNGGVVVAFENCEVIKSAIRHFDTENEDIFEVFADCYQNTACAIMSPNTIRFDLIRQLAKDYEADGVLDITLQTCHPYTVERDKMMRLCKDTLHIPYMAIETDVSDSDTGQLATRIAAFIEML